MKDILLEIDAIKKISQKSVDELKGLSNFFKIFANTYQEEVKAFNIKLVEHDKSYKYLDKYVTDSILSANLVSIYDIFKQYNYNINNLMEKMKNELINPFEVFRDTQFSIYQNNIDELRALNKIYQQNKDILDVAKQNYYQASDIVKKENQGKKLFFTREEKNNYDINIQNKMKAKNLEVFYKYELEKYNKIIPDINNKYNKIQDKIKLADKSRIMFIKTSFDKYRNYMGEYIKNINEFLNVIENFISEDICNKDEKHNKEEFSKFNEENRVKEEPFISFNQFLENEKINKNEKNILKFEMIPSDLSFIDLEEKKINDFIKNLTVELLSENEVPGEEMAKLIELFKYKTESSDIEKKFMDTLLEKRKISSIRFYNLKNLEHLANALNYITFKENSIFEGKFELNFKIIYIAEKIFYQNKINNKKVYLSAILSKNRYYRTKTFWKNVMELKLVHKLQDHIQRLKNYILPEEKNKGFFRKISGILSGDLHKTSLIGKSHILPLLKDYNNLEETRIEIVDKMAIQEMTMIVKNSIPNFSNFNVPSEKCLDLIMEIVQEYKIPIDNMNYYITYSNISGHSIRKLLPHEKDSFKNNDNDNRNKNNAANAKKSKMVKIFENIIPYLTYSDYYNVLLISKYYNKKIKKKIYKYVLKQKNIKKEIRLKIWRNLLNIDKVKKEYDYKKILSQEEDKKLIYEVRLDVDRTAVKPDDIHSHRNKIFNILYAVSLSNDGIKYCQGMNFISDVLYELFGEEEAFYILLSLFKNTEYPLIFAKDLKKLKIFFYVFNRIIQLFEPELSSYLNMNNVTVNTFVPPWFITLFTSSHQYLRNENDNINLIVRILDNFIVSGWKGMMTVGIALLHNYENTVMNKRYDAMLEFLINDIVKSEFFEDKNKDKLEEYFDTIKISKNLIKNIELEYVLDEKLNEIKQ